MSYEKHTWETGETITAEKLNNLENGVASGSGGGGNFVVTFTTEDYQTYTSDKTFAQIESVIASGQNVIGSVMGNRLIAVQYAEGEYIIFSAVVPTSATAISVITLTMDNSGSVVPMETSISQG